jgi:hypothetical protein
VEETHVPAAFHDQLIRSQDERPTPPRLRLRSMLELSEVRSQQLLQVGHAWPLPRDTKNQAGWRYVFLNYGTIRSGNLMQRVALTDHSANFSV